MNSEMNLIFFFIRLELTPHSPLLRFRQVALSAAIAIKDLNIQTDLHKRTRTVR